MCASHSGTADQSAALFLLALSRYVPAPSNGVIGMLKMKFCSLALLAICGLAQPAVAGWQNTKWGSTAAEVAKAMAIKFPAGDPHKADPDNGHTYAASRYAAGKFEFSAAYEFTASKLTGVHLTLLGSEADGCASLRSSLGAKYGKPTEEDRSVPNRRVWRDAVHDNQVELKIYADTFCTVDYSPLKTAATSGL
jgi:hypothetical protein